MERIDGSNGEESETGTKVKDQDLGIESEILSHFFFYICASVIQSLII